MLSLFLFFFFVNYAELIVKVRYELSLLSLAVISFFWHTERSRINLRKHCRGNRRVNAKRSEITIISADYWSLRFILKPKKRKSEIRASTSHSLSLSPEKHSEKKRKGHTWWQGAQKLETRWSCHEIQWRSLNLSSCCPGHVANIHSACL